MTGPSGTTRPGTSSPVRLTRLRCGIHTARPSGPLKPTGFRAELPRPGDPRKTGLRRFIRRTGDGTGLMTGPSGTTRPGTGSPGRLTRPREGIDAARPSGALKPTGFGAGVPRPGEPRRIRLRRFVRRTDDGTGLMTGPSGTTRPGTGSPGRLTRPREGID
ncbi:hypothetical protein ACH46N_27605, partial [Streptomyces pristinaespiralis]